MHRLLRPGGRILFQMGGRGCADAMFRVMHVVTLDRRWSRRFEGFAPPYRFYGPEHYEPWLEAAGFTARRIDLFPKDMQHEGPDEMRGWLRTTWFPYTDRLPPEQRREFLDAVVEAYLEAHPLDAQGRTHVRMVRLEVEAVADQA